jgi:hypothetical protein
MIFLLSEIMPIYSYYTKKGLVYITITALSNYQLSFYFEYTKLNILSDYITWCTNAYLRVRYTSLLFTRSMHQPLLTRRCTNHLFTKLWLIRGDASVYRPRSLLYTKEWSYNLTRLRLRHYVILALGHVFRHIYLSYNIYSISNTKYIYLTVHLYIF